MPIDTNNWHDYLKTVVQEQHPLAKQVINMFNHELNDLNQQIITRHLHPYDQIGVKNTKALGIEWHFWQILYQQEKLLSPDKQPLWHQCVVKTTESDQAIIRLRGVIRFKCNHVGNHFHPISMQNYLKQADRKPRINGYQTTLFAILDNIEHQFLNMM